MLEARFKLASLLVASAWLNISLDVTISGLVPCYEVFETLFVARH
jgi:hypothetical protein